MVCGEAILNIYQSNSISHSGSAYVENRVRRRFRIKFGAGILSDRIEHRDCAIEADILPENRVLGNHGVLGYGFVEIWPGVRIQSERCKCINGIVKHHTGDIGYLNRKCWGNLIPTDVSTTSGGGKKTIKRICRGFAPLGIQTQQFHSCGLKNAEILTQYRDGFLGKIDIRDGIFNISYGVFIQPMNLKKSEHISPVYRFQGDGPKDILIKYIVHGVRNSVFADAY